MWLIGLGRGGCDKENSWCSGRWFRYGGYWECGVFMKGRLKMRLLLVVPRGMVILRRKKMNTAVVVWYGGDDAVACSCTVMSAKLFDGMLKKLCS